MTCLFPPPLATSSPVYPTKRKRSESHYDDAINVSSEAQKRARIRIDEELVILHPLTSTEPILHLATTDMDMVIVEQSTNFDIIEAASPTPTSPVVIYDTHCDVPVPSLGISQCSHAPASFWTFRESVSLIKNEHVILGTYAAKHKDDHYSEEIQDMDVVDPAMGILNGLFSSKLRLDVCTGSQVTKTLFCQCRLNDESVARCDDCSSPFVQHCACIPYSSHRLPPPHPLIRPPFHVPYPRSIRTLWHGSLYPPMEVDSGIALAELGILVLSVPNSKVSIDRRRRRQKELRSWRLR